MPRGTGYAGFSRISPWAWGDYYAMFIDGAQGPWVQIDELMTIFAFGGWVGTDSGHGW